MPTPRFAVGVAVMYCGNSYHIVRHDYNKHTNSYIYTIKAFNGGFLVAYVQEEELSPLALTSSMQGSNIGANQSQNAPTTPGLGAASGATQGGTWYSIHPAQPEFVPESEKREIEAEELRRKNLETKRSLRRFLTGGA
jgi:hypothetical protein